VIGYKTKRNAAAGIINRDDHSKLQYLYVIFHTVANPLNWCPTEFSRLTELSRLFDKDNVVKFIQVLKKDEVT